MVYRLTEEAEEDVIGVLREGIELFGLRQAEAYYANLISTFEFLAENPRAARERDEIDPPARVHPFVSHLIVYRVQEPDILIIAIRHSRQDWSRFDR